MQKHSESRPSEWKRNLAWKQQYDNSCCPKKWQLNKSMWP